MNRRQIFDVIDSLYPCYAIGEHEGYCIEPYVVLKFDNQVTSINNNKCGWQSVQVMCYTPKSDITVLDEMIDKVKNVLSGVLEFIGTITSEFLDNDVKAYTRSMSYRIPKEVR